MAEVGCEGRSEDYKSQGAPRAQGAEARGREAWGMMGGVVRTAAPGDFLWLEKGIISTHRLDVTCPGAQKPVTRLPTLKKVTQIQRKMHLEDTQNHNFLPTNATMFSETSEGATPNDTALTLCLCSFT